MTLDQRTRESLLAHCGELHEDDGVDPRRFLKIEENSDKQNHKARQLCKQIAQTLGLVLAGDFADGRIQGLYVDSVEPAPNASQLSVTLRTLGPCDSTEAQEIRNHLAAISGQLRTEVAAAISRKRTPRLQFRVIGPTDRL